MEILKLEAQVWETLTPTGFFYFARVFIKTRRRKRSPHLSLKFKYKQAKLHFYLKKTIFAQIFINCIQRL